MSKVKTGTVTRVLHQLSTATGSTAGQVANRANVSPSTARKHLAELREAGQARRDDESGEWYAVRAEEPTQPAKKTRKPRKPAPEATPDTELEKALGQSVAERSVVAFLAGLGFSERLARQDAPVVELLRDAGPLSEAEVEDKLGRAVPGWTFRRLTEGKHGRLTFDPVLEAVGRGDERKYQAVR